MFRKIASVLPLENLKLLVWFQGGDARIYDVAPLLKKWEAFEALQDDSLFEQVRVDAGGYGISWNDEIDLAGNELYENGLPVDIAGQEKSRIVKAVADARKDARLSQAAAEEASGVRQPVIARMEHGDTSPRLDTVLKVLAPLGKTLAVTDLAVHEIAPE